MEGAMAYVGAPGASLVCTYRLDDNLSEGPMLTAEGVNVDFGYSFAVSGNRLVGGVAQEPFRSEYRNYIEGFELNDNTWRSTGILDPGIKRRMMELRSALRRLSLILTSASLNGLEPSSGGPMATATSSSSRSGVLRYHR